MNETLRIIAKRYSCRAFTDQAPTDSQLTTVAEAAPSGVNRQPWRVIVVRDRGLMAELEAEAMAVLSAQEDRATYDRMMQRGGKLFYNAPAMMVLPLDGAAGGSKLDCGILCQTAVLAAESLGLNTLICGLAGLAFAGDKAEYFKERLGFPQGYEFGIAILLGHSAADGAPHQPDASKISYIG